MCTRCPDGRCVVCTLRRARTTLSLRWQAHVDQMIHAGVGRNSPGHGRRTGGMPRDHAAPSADLHPLTHPNALHTLSPVHFRLSLTHGCVLVMRLRSAVGLGRSGRGHVRPCTTSVPVRSLSTVLPCVRVLSHSDAPASTLRICTGGAIQWIATPRVGNTMSCCHYRHYIILKG